MNIKHKQNKFAQACKNYYANYLSNTQEQPQPFEQWLEQNGEKIMNIISQQSR